MNENEPKSKDVFVSREGGTDQSPEEIMERKKRCWNELFDEGVRKKRVLQKEKQRKGKQKALDKKPN